MPPDWVKTDAIEAGLQVYEEEAPGVVMPEIRQELLEPGQYAELNCFRFAIPAEVI